MRQLIAPILFTALVCTPQEAAARPPQSDLQGQPQESSTTGKSTITVPAGTKVALALTTPVWAKTAKPGDSVYSATAFPVAVNNEMAIPPGTYVEGKIDALTRPSWRSNHAEFQMHFTKLIFANGYTVVLPDVTNDISSSGNPEMTSQVAVQNASPGNGTANANPVKIEAAIARVYVQVSSASDLLLDNGTQIEMVLQSPLSLEADSVAAAVRRSKPLQITQFKSATRCVPTSGTPGTPDTVIPGTPGMPGTPDTVIPGGPGMPETVIPGIPATPGTPPTVIPGSPGTVGAACPGPPIVTTKPVAQDVHTKSFQLASSLQIAGAQLSPGKYQATWAGLGSTAQLDILQNKKLVVRVQARVVTLEKKSAADESVSRTNPDGSVSLEALKFAEENFALFFD